MKAKFEKDVSKRTKHYEITKEDFSRLLSGEEIFFYEGKEINIYFKLDDCLLGDDK